MYRPVNMPAHDDAMPKLELLSYKRVHKILISYIIQRSQQIGIVMTKCLKDWENDFS